MKTVTAYHFVGATLRDGQPIPKNGVWLKHKGPVTMCESGLHASRHPFDALQYAPGATLCKVECRDIVSTQSDKLVCRQRRIVARIDATDMLRAFARQCALDVVHLWDAPPVVVEYLKTGDESLQAAARDAAGDAARDAAGAARDAARDGARDGAWGGAWDAWDAAWDARHAAGDARHAAGDALAAAGDAWDAAWDATRRKQRKRFVAMVRKEFAKVTP